MIKPYGSYNAVVSGVVGRGRECEAAGQAEAGLARILHFYSSSLDDYYSIMIYFNFISRATPKGSASIL